MPRVPKPFLYRGHFITTAGGKKIKLATEAEGLAVAENRLREFLALPRGDSPPAARSAPVAGGITFAELLEKYLDHARVYYRLPDGSPSRELADIPLSARELLAVHGSEPAASMTRQTFREAQRRAIDAGLSRRVVNQRQGRMRRLIRWAASHDLIPVQILTECMLVDPLPAGRSPAPETASVEPVTAATVFATLAHLAEPWATMARLQWVTGMRPGEVCAMRVSYLSPTGRMSLLADFKKDHKMAYRGRARRIPLGPGATLLLSPWIGRAMMRGSDFLFFSPRTGTCVRRRSYDHVVAKAAKAAGVPHWHPNQIRHAFGTRVRAVLGLDAAQAALGHSKADVTQVYAKLGDELAARVARQLG